MTRPITIVLALVGVLLVVAATNDAIDTVHHMRRVSEDQVLYRRAVKSRRALPLVVVHWKAPDFVCGRVCFRVVRPAHGAPHLVPAPDLRKVGVHIVVRKAA
jgi:hypothetical protein